MEHKLPVWLDKDVLSTSLEGAEDNKLGLRVVEFSGEPAVPLGTNLCSDIWRVRVKCAAGASQKTLSLIVKSVPAATSQVLSRIVVNETEAYRKLLPEMEAKLNHSLGPKCFYCSVNHGLILEDLVDDGYVVCSSPIQLDYAHCEQVLIAIAKFHAASVAYHHDDANFIESIGEDFVNNAGTVIKPLSKRCMQIIADVTEEMEEYKFSNFIKTRAEHVWESIISFRKPKAKGLNVLNHGDLRQNNVLFKHNHLGVVVDLRLIDFAVPVYTSPALDLVYFIWTSADDSVRDQRQHDLHDIYLRTLNTTLEQLGCSERMTMTELQQDLRSADDYVLRIICSILPMVMIEPDNALKWGDFSAEDIKQGKLDNILKKLFRGTIYKTLLPNYIKQFMVQQL